MRASGTLLKPIVTIGGIAALLTMLAALRPYKAAAATCPPSITACCTIASPGTYNLADSLTLLSSGVCIDVAASNVTLIGVGTSIVGPGSSSASVGVYVEATAPTFS